MSLPLGHLATRETLFCIPDALTTLFQQGRLAGISFGLQINSEDAPFHTNNIAIHMRVKDTILTFFNMADVPFDLKDDAARAVAALMFSPQRVCNTRGLMAALKRMGARHAAPHCYQDDMEIDVLLVPNGKIVGYTDFPNPLDKALAPLDDCPNPTPNQVKAVAETRVDPWSEIATFVTDVPQSAHERLAICNELHLAFEQWRAINTTTHWTGLYPMHVFSAPTYST